MKSNLERFLVLRHKARTDIWFLSTVLHYYEMVEFHIEYHNKALEYLDNPEYPYTLIMFPRGWFKTSLFTITKTIQNVLDDPESRTLLVSYTGDNVKGMLGELADHFIANEDLRFLFPDICPTNTNRPETGTWNSASIVVKRKRNWKEGTVDALGADQNPVSRHYDFIRVDDLVVDKNTQNYTQIQKTVAFWKKLPPLQQLHRQSVINVIGTRWVPDDLHGMMEDGTMPAPNGRPFKTLNVSAEYKDSNDERKSTWPEIFSLEKLDGLRISMGRSYSALMLNDPEDAENAIWTRDMLVEYIELPEVPFDFYGFLDPSISEKDTKTNSDTVVGVLGIDPDNQVWLCDYSISKGTAKINGQIFDYYVKYREKLGTFKYFSMETILFQKLLARDLRVEMQKRNIWIPIYEDTPFASKDSRIMILDPLIQNKAFHIRTDMHEARNQIVRFKRPGVKNDIIDGCAQAYKVSQIKAMASDSESRPQIARFARIAAERRKQWEEGRGTVKGYLGQLTA